MTARHQAVAVMVLAGLSGAACLSCRDQKAQPRVIVNGESFSVEIADTSAARGRGLGGRGSLAEDKGMLFVFDSAKPQDFYMLECYFAIDIAFIDAEGRIINLETMAMEPDPARPLRRYPSHRPAKYILETVGGTWRRIGAAAGMRVEFVDIPGTP